MIKKKKDACHDVCNIVWTDLINVLLSSLCSSQGAHDLAFGVEYGDDGDVLASLLDEAVDY